MDGPRDDIVNDGTGRLHPQRIEAPRRLQTQQGHRQRVVATNVQKFSRKAENDFRSGRLFSLVALIDEIFYMVLLSDI